MSIKKKWLKDFCFKIMYPNHIPVRYFKKEQNVGDLLNEYLLPKISGKQIFRCRGQSFRHLLGIGSIAGGAGPKSIIWGCGFIDGSGFEDSVNADYIFALRGTKTKAIAEAHCKQHLDVPLGDPGLLMKMFFDPAVNTDKKVGIVFHHSENDMMQRIKCNLPDHYLCINVALAPEDFVRQMKRCEVILSSSLHGLILADAYGIPNKWLSFSDRLLGGTWKFLDYYSTTSTPDEASLKMKDPRKIFKSEKTFVSHAKVSEYRGNKDSLLASFPIQLF